MARASAFQAEGRGFESRFPLTIWGQTGGAISAGLPTKMEVFNIVQRVIKVREIVNFLGEKASEKY